MHYIWYTQCHMSKCVAYLVFENSIDVEESAMMVREEYSNVNKSNVTYFTFQWVLLPTWKINFISPFEVGNSYSTSFLLCTTPKIERHHKYGILGAPHKQSYRKSVLRKGHNSSDMYLFPIHTKWTTYLLSKFNIVHI